MWITFYRPPVPDAPYWPGRRMLAVLDAIGWPAVAFALLMLVPGRAGVFVTVAGAVCLVLALSRIRVALWLNHRYRFTTWRVGKVVMVLLLMGLVLKLGVWIR